MVKFMMSGSACLASTVLLLALLAVASAKPRYLAIPLDDVALVEVAEAAAGEEGTLPALVRVPRRAPAAGVPIPRVERSHHHHHHHDDGGHHHHHGPHVDYGAHTGHHGAFGWYADFPVHTHHGH